VAALRALFERARRAKYVLESPAVEVGRPRRLTSRRRGLDEWELGRRPAGGGRRRPGGDPRRGRGRREFAIDDAFMAVMAHRRPRHLVANWYGGNEVGLEFGPALPLGLQPSGLYPMDRVADAYADLALRMVTAPGPVP
jgi:hypothetical protein